MSIKQTYGNVEDIPAGLETIYAKGEDGTFNFVGAEGMVDKGRLDEFRDNNITLRQEVEGYEQSVTEYETKLADMAKSLSDVEYKFSGIDLEAHAKQQAEAKALLEKEMIEAGEVDKLVNGRVDEVLTAKQKEMEALKSTYESQLAELNEDLVGYDFQLNKMLVDNELTKIAADKGVRASALEDVLSRGRNVFRVEDGQATAFNEEGRPLYAGDAVTPLSIDGWVEGLTKSAPHLFEMSSGSGTNQPTAAAAPAPAASADPHDNILAGLAALNNA